ncbi:hypothetical protein [Jiella pelagia]|uniref:Uncharacterized protein n=1 Tax=Jiella pelagia TaxID=2986949 RepID=A0ABY7C5J9_9HYPH|nr:hypothetical protein [Jiella pelagia]WAP69110.1 hypothetical protein OH818_01910 [Jiella pelagia]
MEVRDAIADIGLPLSSHIRNGELWVGDPDLPNGTDGRVSMQRFGTIRGEELLWGPYTKVGYLMKVASSIREILDRLDGMDLRRLDPAICRDFANRMPEARRQADDIFAGFRRRQAFLTQGTVDRLTEWSKHPGAPLAFSISRERRWLHLSVPDRPGRAGMRRTLTIGKWAEEAIPELPSVDAELTEKATA